MASSYMLADRVQGYEVKVTETARGRKIVERKTFKDYNAAMRFLDEMEEKYYRVHTVEFKTLYQL